MKIEPGLDVRQARPDFGLVLRQNTFRKFNLFPLRSEVERAPASYLASENSPCRGPSSGKHGTYKTVHLALSFRQNSSKFLNLFPIRSEEERAPVQPPTWHPRTARTEAPRQANIALIRQSTWLCLPGKFPQNSSTCSLFARKRNVHQCSLPLGSLSLSLPLYACVCLSLLRSLSLSACLSPLSVTRSLSGRSQARTEAHHKANSAHVRQSRPDYGLVVQEKNFNVFSIRSEEERAPAQPFTGRF